MTFMRQKPPAYWGTESEIKFLEGLGTHAAHNTYTVEELLDFYIHASVRRSDWGIMDKKKVLAAAGRLLKVVKGT